MNYLRYYVSTFTLWALFKSLLERLMCSNKSENKNVFFSILLCNPKPARFFFFAPKPPKQEKQKKRNEKAGRAVNSLKAEKIFKINKQMIKNGFYRITLKSQHKIL